MASNGMSGMVMGGVVLLVLALAGWYLLQQQSAAISNKSLAMASGSASSTSSKQPKVVITGLMNTGKTALWCHLRFSQTSVKSAAPMTQTSMALNIAEAYVNETRALLVDVPGHQKFHFDRTTQLSQARAVVFVVDSAQLAKNTREAAECLYEVLANQHVQEKEVPVLVVCNKQDDPLALANTRIQALLEDEIDRLRGSRQAGLDSVQDTAYDDAAAEERARDFLGFEGKRFAFEDVVSPVQFNEATMVVGHDAGGLEQIERWIADALQN
ncbi:hypothetical protein H4R22_003629 [Coemansia sp. RSA 1290]|nr:hypothetical protein H4R22_003629 [Coemansia sp. RSA 1290]KAJ2653341.1 hypothetical protein IWW40_000394 [Coemansia sp. RSA 1250]